MAGATPAKDRERHAMGALSLWHWIIVVLVVVILFGGGRIAGVMGDLGKGIRSFKKELSEDAAASSGTVASDPAKLTPPQADAEGSAASSENKTG
jgi:sec-independent protein translocase protein TatA